MRKFSARWWITPELLQWRHMTACGDYWLPFFMWPEMPLREVGLGEYEFGPKCLFTGWWLK